MRAIVLGVLVLLLATAHADDKGDRKAAERHFRIAEKAYQRQNFGAAAEHFEEAFKLLPVPEIAFSAAQAYRRHYRVERKLKLAERAVELYKFYLSKIKTGGRVGDAADYLDSMEREVFKLKAEGEKSSSEHAADRTTLVINPELAAEPTSGLLREVTDRTEDDTTNMTVLLDGKPVAPYEKIDVAPGPHKIHVEAEGYLPADASERAVKDVSVIANVLLTPRPARVTVKTDEGARIRVDGRLVSTPPTEPIEVPAGAHVISIARAGRQTVTRDVTVSRGQELTLREPLEKTTQRKLVPWVAGVAGAFTVFSVASVIGAIVVDSRASDQLNELRTTGDQTPAQAADYQALIDQRRQFTIGAYVGGGAALAIGGLAAAMYFFDSPSDDGVHVAPAVTATGAGVTLGGRF